MAVYIVMNDGGYGENKTIGAVYSRRRDADAAAAIEGAEVQTWPVVGSAQGEFMKNDRIPPVPGEDLPATRLVEAEAARKAAQAGARLDALEKNNSRLWARLEAAEQHAAEALNQAASLRSRVLALEAVAENCPGR